jgi:hypothetical protein
MNGANNSTRKLAIGFSTKPDGSRWVYADLVKYGPPHPRWIPSFLDLHRIIQAIAECEDARYPPPAQGRGKLADFLRACVWEADFNTIAEYHKIPERDGDRVVNTNGARLRDGSLPLFQQPDKRF